MKRFVFLNLLLLTVSLSVSAQSTQLKYSDFDSWITRDIKESIIIGGKKQELYEIGPTGTWDGKKPYTNQGGSPWANSNIMAKVAGVVKTNVSVYPEPRGDGQCVKMVSHIVGVKVLGLVNIHVLAAGSIYVGKMLEPITSSSNPFGYLDYGIPFTQKPKAVQFDYKVKLSDKPDRIRQTGFSPVKRIPGKDMPGMILLLQKRWEDEKGNLYARRIGTVFHRFGKDTDWVNGAQFEIHYGDITHESFFQPYMNLFSGGDDQKYALNSKGKIVPVKEVEWGTADDTPTHLCLQFASSFGTAYVGAVGTTLWIDNLKLIY
ncbi:MAG: PCMD domain-containing protein [Bacteroidaceae bacterium]|nr:PCMD domain-containing protein [Bacteroidaceae bacterium]